MNSFKEIRLSKGLSQSDLASKVGLTRAAVAQWESGKSVPKIKQLPKLAIALNCKIEDLLYCFV